MADYKIHGQPDNLYAQTVTIASGASTSEWIAPQGKALIGIQMPAAWTAAKIAINAGVSPNSLGQVYDNAGNRAAVTVAASEFIAIPLDSAVFAPYLSLSSVDGSGNPVNQGQDAVIILLLRRYLS